MAHTRKKVINKFVNKRENDLQNQKFRWQGMNVVQLRQKYACILNSIVQGVCILGTFFFWMNREHTSISLKNAIKISLDFIKDIKSYQGKINSEVVRLSFL